MIYLFVYDTVLFTDSEEVHRMIDEFYSIYKRRKLKVNAG